MLNRFRQTGAFILATVIFLMVAGGAMLYAMTNLSTVSSATNSVAHNGNMALAAAQSGLKYCLYILDTAGGGASCSPYPDSSGITPPPCTITINHTCLSSPCAISSEATCWSGTPLQGVKRLKVQAVLSGGRYQMVPASLQAY
jgi:hypothetical protein